MISTLQVRFSHTIYNDTEVFKHKMSKVMFCYDASNNTAYTFHILPAA